MMKIECHLRFLVLQEFTSNLAVLDRMEFSSLYTFRIRAVNQLANTESKPFVYQVSSPACLDVYNGSLHFCREYTFFSSIGLQTKFVRSQILIYGEVPYMYITLDQFFQRQTRKIQETNHQK
jgi:hypothetical protein